MRSNSPQRAALAVESWDLLPRFGDLEDVSEMARFVAMVDVARFLDFFRSD